MEKIAKTVFKLLLGIIIFVFVFDFVGSIVGVVVEVLPPKPRINLNKKTIKIDGLKLPVNPLKNRPFPYLGIHSETFLSTHQRLALINHAIYPGLGIALIDNQDRFIKWLPEGELELLEKGELKSAGEVFNWWQVKSLNGRYRDVIVIQFGITGTARVSPFYLYTKHGENWKLALKLVEASSRTEIRDINEDGTAEIVHHFSLSGSGKLERDLLRWKNIWQVDEGRAVLVNHKFPQEFEYLIDFYDHSLNTYPDATRYESVFACLEKKAQLIINGQNVNQKECRDELLDRVK